MKRIHRFSSFEAACGRGHGISEVAVSLVCGDNVIMCGVRLVVDPPGRLFAEPSGRAT